MVVAASATHGQSHERQGRRSDQIIQRVLPPALTSASAFGAEPQETGRDHRFLRVGRVLVARELFTNELIVRLIVVERFDHVIAIAPRLGTIHVELEAARIGVANQVEPVARPSLAVMRTGEQPVDQSLPGSGRGVFDEGLDLFRVGRQSRQIEIGATDERAAVRPRRGFETFGLHLRQQKSVNRIGAPDWMRHAAEGRAARRLEGPETALLRRDRALDEFCLLGVLSGRRLLVESVERSARLDPASQSLDRGVGELLARRHSRLRLMRNELIEPARVRVGRLDDLAVVSAREKRFTRPQIQPRHLCRAVTAEAILPQDGVCLA
jgi:hypothetical protein